MYWKDYGPNRLGVTTHPLAVCLGSFGTFFFVDYADGCLFKARLDNPVGLELLVDELAKRTGVTYTKGVVYVAEESAVDLRRDVCRCRGGGGVEAETNWYAKTPVGGGAKQERVIGEWGKIHSCSNEGASFLVDVRSTGKARASEILIDGLSPMALVSDEKM